jgi:thiol-disulfide isomerase/thioredoxin
MLRHRNEFPVEGRFPGFDGATTWLNSEPLTPAALEGRVVLVNFGTYTCINWMRSLPYVRAWADKYAAHGLVVVGVQTPEFEFEGDLGNVQRAIKEMNVTYPVVVDNDYAVWNAFDNHYWPALYLVDATGSIRHHHFGEGEYEESEMVLQMLLAEAGADVGDGLVQIVPDGPEAAADWHDLRSPESYLGFARATGFVSAEDVEPDRSQRYTAPSDIGRNEWALSGEWTVGAAPVGLDAPGGSISFRFHARDVHLVMGPPTSHDPVRYRVRLDGEPPGLAHGVDIDEDGNGTADYQRMYQLIRQPQPIVDRTFEIEFLDNGVEAFVFTFG